MTPKTAANHRVFSKSVDKRSRKAMTDFLSEHFRYSTSNNWAHSTSYACNMKIHSLGLDFKTVDKLYDMLWVPEFFDGINNLIQQFDQRHQFRWQAGWSGRSGGYLVLCQGTLKASEYRSFCTNCGQKNFRSVAETGPRCGVCSEGTRVDYLTPPKQIVIYPGKGTDMDVDFEDWTLADLRNRTELVQEFDQLADDIVSEGLHMAENKTVVERTIYVPTTELAFA